MQVLPPKRSSAASRREFQQSRSACGQFACNLGNQKRNRILWRVVYRLGAKPQVQDPDVAATTGLIPNAGQDMDLDIIAKAVFIVLRVFPFPVKPLQDRRSAPPSFKLDWPNLMTIGGFHQVLYSKPCEFGSEFRVTQK